MAVNNGLSSVLEQVQKAETQEAKTAVLLVAVIFLYDKVRGLRRGMLWLRIEVAILIVMITLQLATHNEAVKGASYDVGSSLLAFFQALN